MSETIKPEPTMPADELLALHPLPWSHHLLLIKDANGRQVIHTGGVYSERGRPHEGAYLSGLNALFVEAVNSRVRVDGAAPTVDEDAALKKRARQIIDAVVRSPCVVEVRFFSQPEESEKLENEVAALIAPTTATAAPAKQSELPATDALDDVLEHPRTADADTLAVARVQLAALKCAKHFPATAAPVVPVGPETPIGSEAQKCVKCGHDQTYFTGLCAAYTAGRKTSEGTKMVMCGCKCEFTPVPATGADEGERAKRLVEGWLRDRRLLNQRTVTMQDARILTEWVAAALNENNKND